MRIILFIAMVGFLNNAAATPTSKTAPLFSNYVDDLIEEAQQRGISEKTILAVKPSVKFRESVVKADNNQPEKRITLSDYLSSRVPDWKVDQAVKLYKSNEALLLKIEQEYSVPARFIVALWGNESNFGKIQGNYPVLSSLASLAFEGRRESLFRSQFFAALTIIDEGHINIEEFKGSWAGAMGQSQFMPTNFLAYAVDYDQDGRKDIWYSVPDVLASIANFLKQNGWQNQYTWGRQVNADSIDDLSITGLGKSLAKPLSEWSDLGVRKYNGTTLPNASISAWLIMPDGKTGRHYLVYDNFQTLMRWNRSSYFGISVSYLSERIKKGVKK